MVPKARMLTEQYAPPSTRASLPGRSGVQQSAYKPLSRPMPRLSQITPPRQSELSTLWVPTPHWMPKRESEVRPARPDGLPGRTSPALKEKEAAKIRKLTGIHANSTENKSCSPEREVDEPKNAAAGEAEGASAAKKSLSPTGQPQAKSSVRRRPRQQRRCTGITYEVQCT